MKAFGAAAPLLISFLSNNTAKNISRSNRKLFSTSMTSSTTKGRKIAHTQTPTPSGPIFRLIGTVDIDGKGTNHPLAQVDPFMLLDYANIPESNIPKFGAHPHRGHSVVTLLLQGQEKSWDSYTQTHTVVDAPASYWVDAGSGIFHDEVSVVPNSDDKDQHIKLYQLWITVQEQDRLKQAGLQYDTELPVVDAVSKSGDNIGSITYFVGGKNDKIATPHPIVVAHIKQSPNSELEFPIDPSHGGFLVHIGGSPTVGGSVTPEVENEILVLDNNDDTTEDFVTVKASAQPAEYLVCVGETIGEPWYKKLVASGAVIAKSEQEARDIASKVEGYAAAGKSGSPGSSFAPFGA